MQIDRVHSAVLNGLAKERIRDQHTVFEVPQRIGGGVGVFLLGILHQLSVGPVGCENSFLISAGHSGKQPILRHVAIRDQLHLAVKIVIGGIRQLEDRQTNESLREAFLSHLYHLLLKGSLAFFCIIS